MIVSGGGFRNRRLVQSLAAPPSLHKSRLHISGLNLWSCAEASACPAVVRAQHQIISLHLSPSVIILGCAWPVDATSKN